MAAKLDPAELKKGKSQSYKDCPMSLLCLLASQSRIEDYDTDVDFVWRHSIDHQTNERIDFWFLVGVYEKADYFYSGWPFQNGSLPRSLDFPKEKALFSHPQNDQKPSCLDSQEAFFSSPVLKVISSEWFAYLNSSALDMQFPNR